MKKTVIIDSFPESVELYKRTYAVVAVDVIRASTTIVTALSTGRRCFPVPTIEAARVVSARLSKPLWAGEISGEIPPGFEMNNSPAELARRPDIGRPLILLSSSGTRLIHLLRDAAAAYVGCFRNDVCLARHLAEHHPHVAIIGAGSRGDFREEDQMGCARIARELFKFGYRPETPRTEEIVEIWGSKKLDAIVNGRSADYLRRSGQEEDLSFVLNHLDDLDLVAKICGDEAVNIPLPRPGAVPLRKPVATGRTQPLPAL